MKRFSCVIISFAMLAGLLCGCASKPDEDANQTETKPVQQESTKQVVTEELLYKTGLEVIEEVNAVVRGMVAIGESELYSLVQGVPGAVHSAYKVTASMGAIESFFSENGASNVSDEFLEHYRSYWGSGCAEFMNVTSEYGGPTAISLQSNMAIGSTAFVARGLSNPITYLYQYQADICYAVTFIPYDDDIIVATGQIIIHKDLAHESSSQGVKEVLESVYPFDLQVTKVNT